MKGYRLEVKGEVECLIACDLFKEVGFLARVWVDDKDAPRLILAVNLDSRCMTFEDYDWITIQELKDMVILRRNNPEDATHACDYPSGLGIKLSGEWYAYNYNEKKWQPWVDDHEYKLKDLKPTQKEEVMKEYLIPSENSYSYCKSASAGQADWFEIPEGAEIAYTLKKEDMDFDYNGVVFYGRINGVVHINSNCTEGWERIRDQEFFNKLNESLILVWKRETLNDQVASAEVARQESKELDDFIESNVESDSAWSKQEGGSHYKNMEIQPMEFALKNNLDYAQANVVKYVCRHANKNGKQDLLKAIHNIELMIEFYYPDKD